MRTTANITVRSHGFTVTDFNDDFYRAMCGYAATLVDHKLESIMVNGKRVLVKKPDRVFAASTTARKEMRFHINCLAAFKNHMQNKGWHPGRFKMIEDKPGEGVDVKFELSSPNVGPRDDGQREWLKYQMEKDPSGITTKINNARTGGGKSFMSIYNMFLLGKRTIVTLSPKYLQTWLDALNQFLKISPTDICVVRGSDEVNGLMKQAAAGTLQAKVIIISLQTYQYFMSEYEDNNGVMTHYDHTPDEFWKILNPGFLVVDEGHESIHALFKYDLYLNVRNKLICTATLEADSAFINEMYRVIYPMKYRFKQGAYDKYIESVAVMYGLKSTKQIKYKGFGGTYSHVKFEQSILKKDHHIAEYMRFINGLVDFFYIKVMQPGMKLLVYCATVDMCVVVTDYLERFYRAQGLSVAKYTQEDPTSALYENDIVVSTLKSAGTGVDIPGLRTVIMTVAVGSMQINIQSLGRLRELKAFPGVTPSFVYTCCTDIMPHMQYHRKKLQIFADKTLSQRSMNSGFSL